MSTATLEPPQAPVYQPQIPGLIAMPPAMAALAQEQNWNYFRLMIGSHEEKIRPEERDEDGSLRCLRIKRGDVFRSPSNLLAHNRGSEKFQLLYGGGQFQPGNNPNQMIWDMTRETLEQFNERMKNRPAASMQPVGYGQVMPQAQLPVPNMPENIVPPGAVPNGNPVQQVPVANAALPPLPPSAQVDLAEYDEKKLRAVAAEEEVDVSRCRSKADLVGTLRKVLGNKVR